MPPQHGKSELISRWFPVWYLGKFPMHRILHNSYGDRYSQSWGRRARGSMRECSQLFGVAVSDEKAEMREWELTVGGSMFSAGVRGECTGRAADLLITDDPHKNAEEASSEIEQEKSWDMYQSGPLTRLADDGCMVGVATRWHQRDLLGRLMERWDSERVPYRYVNLEAICESPDDELGRADGEALCPDLKSLAFLENQRKTLSAYWWNALYQGRPTAHERVEFPDEYFDEMLWVDSMPRDCTSFAIGFDPSKGKHANRGDYQASVCVGFKAGVAYVDAKIERVPIGKAVENTLSLAFGYGAQTIAYEANNFQELIGAEFERQLQGHRFHGIQIVPLLNTTSKEGRIQSLDPYLKGRELRFVRSEGTKLLWHQLRQFPLGRHDDGPDALEMAIRTLLTMIQTDDNAPFSTIYA